MRYLVVNRNARGEVLGNGYLRNPDIPPGYDRWTNDRSRAVRLVAEMAGQYSATDYWAIDAVALEEVTGG